MTAKIIDYKSIEERINDILQTLAAWHYTWHYTEGGYEDYDRKYATGTTEAKQAINALLVAEYKRGAVDELEMIPRITYSKVGKVSDLSILLQSQHLKQRLAALKANEQEKP